MIYFIQFQDEGLDEALLSGKFDSLDDALDEAESIMGSDMNPQPFRILELEKDKPVEWAESVYFHPKWDHEPKP